MGIFGSSIVIFCIIAEDEMELCYKALEIQKPKDGSIVPHSNTPGDPPKKDIAMTMTCFDKEQEENTNERLGGPTVCWNEERCVCLVQYSPNNHCAVPFCWPVPVCTSK